MPAASAIKVLVADDHETMRTLVRRSLQDMGFRNIRTSRNPREALQALEYERAHLIISDFDYELPDTDGLWFLKTIRDDPAISKTVFIMLSGSGDDDVVRRALALGAHDYIMKPFSPRNLRARIERLFGPLT